MAESPASWRWRTNGADGQTADECEVSADGLEALFHRRYSGGAALATGDRPLERDRLHYWEVRLLTEPYGTEVAVGAATRRALLEAAALRTAFEPPLGATPLSFGLSYAGVARHGGLASAARRGFGKGQAVGVLLDLWRGEAVVFVDRRPAARFRGLRRHASLYPVVASTASRSAVRLAYAESADASLAAGCVRALRLSPRLSAAAPGLRALFRRAFWLLLPDADGDDDDETAPLERSRRAKAVATSVVPVAEDPAEPTPDDVPVHFFTRRPQSACDRCNRRNASVRVDGQAAVCVDCFRSSL